MRGDGTTPEGLPMPAMSPDVRMRFWSKVRRSSGCWLWVGAKRRGYGIFRIGDKTYSAHRLAYELLVEAIPAGHVPDHGTVCSNRACVNPLHLDIVTLEENTRRANALRPPPRGRKRRES